MLPGYQANGQVLLPTQWSLQPAGKQIKLGDFPVNIALHPSGRWAAVLHAGFQEHEIQIVDLSEEKVLSAVTLPQAFYGLCFDAKGEQLFASGGEYRRVHRYRFENGYLVAQPSIDLGTTGDKWVTTGVSLSPDQKTLYAANSWGDTLSFVPLADPQQQEHLQFEPKSFPYYALPSTDGTKVYVSLWGKAQVAVVDVETQQILTTYPTEKNPTEMLLAPNDDVLFVACANSNNVSVIDLKTGKGLEVISSALYPNAPNGSTPNSIALTPDGQILLVANADNNNVAVVNVSKPGQSRPLGFIPAGWYPTNVRIRSQDRQILIANGKGLQSKANPRGPNPVKNPPRNLQEYIGRLNRGTLSVLEFPKPQQLISYSKTAYACSPLDEKLAPRTEQRSPDNPIPAKLGDSSPIKHCIYVIKENRTYDQVFGDLPQGNGDPNLCIFGEKVTPNHHALAKQFVLLDNFYVESEVSADGHEWTVGAYATDFVEKSWPLLYRGGRGVISYPGEGAFKAAQPAGGYIWDRCAEAGVSYRSYGEFIRNAARPGQPGTAKVKALENHFDPLYRSYDLDYMDIKRTERFVEELNEFEKNGELPQFIVLRLPNDHTYGTRLGKRTPTAMVADNDLALGRLVEAISQSKFWKETAIFVVEDDAQNGSDHVDAHRTLALVISPYTKRKFVDSSFYSTSSMLRTMELILNLKPMSQFDAAARPMYHSFQAKPDFTPYTHLPAQVNLEERNLPSAFGVKLSEELDFSSEDAADDILLNEIVWKSVRGADSPMPPPVRASFVFPVEDEDEEEEDDEHE